MLLRGARQTGKTFLLRQFGEREYDRVAYCNFEADPGLEGFFRRDLDPNRIPPLPVPPSPIPPAAGPQWRPRCPERPV